MRECIESTGGQSENDESKIMHRHTSQHHPGSFLSTLKSLWPTACETYLIVIVVDARPHTRLQALVRQNSVNKGDPRVTDPAP
jgi:hypothetical protein